MVLLGEVAEAKDLLSPLVVGEGAPLRSRRPTIILGRAILGDITGGGSRVQQTPRRRGTDEEFRFLTRRFDTFAKSATSGARASGKQAKFMSIYAYYVWGQSNDLKLATAKKVMDDVLLFLENDRQFSTVDENCSDEEGDAAFRDRLGAGVLAARYRCSTSAHADSPGDRPNSRPCGPVFVTGPNALFQAAIAAILFGPIGRPLSPANAAVRRGCPHLPFVRDADRSVPPQHRNPPAHTRPWASASSAYPSSSPARPRPRRSPDQVFRFNERTSKTQAFTCTVTSDGLAKVQTTRRDGKNQSIDSVDIIEIVWGEVPASFADGATYAKRGDWESAVKSYQEAAGDSGAREPVRAAARFRSIEALLAWGAADSARFADAVSESDRFLVDPSDNRRLSNVRAMKARASWLSGDPVAARDGYRALFDTGKGGADGYRPLDTANAGLAGAYAALAAGDNVGARELFDLAKVAFGGIESEIATVKAAAAAGIEVSSLGEPLTQVASGDAKRAKSALEAAARSNKTAAG